MEPAKLTHIYNIWTKVLELIVKGKGTSQLVEKWRRKDATVEDMIYGEERKDILLPSAFWDVASSASEDSSDTSNNHNNNVDA